MFRVRFNSFRQKWAVQRKIARKHDRCQETPSLPPLNSNKQADRKIANPPVSRDLAPVLREICRYVNRPADPQVVLPAPEKSPRTSRPTCISSARLLSVALQEAREVYLYLVSRFENNFFATHGPFQGHQN